MTYQGDNPQSWTKASAGLPGPIDCETQALLRLFLGPILENSSDWTEIRGRLTEKGYGMCIREGRLVILNEQGSALCTGRGLGVPLAQIADRIGRPNIRMHPDGVSGDFS